VILSHVDLAATVEARKAAPLRFVTRAMNAVEFRQPVYVGDIVSFLTETVHVGRSSITVRVVVEADRFCEGCEQHVRVTEAEVTLVAVDEQGVKRAIREG
jgi:acyl-CoA thioesterase YciA